LCYLIARKFFRRNYPKSIDIETTSAFDEREND
jgi:hypothetical protein